MAAFVRASAALAGVARLALTSAAASAAAAATVPLSQRASALARPAAAAAAALAPARGFRSGVTKSSVKKRFTLRKSGAVIRKKANKRHLNMNKSSARLLRLCECARACAAGESARHRDVRVLRVVCHTTTTTTMATADDGRRLHRLPALPHLSLPPAACSWLEHRDYPGVQAQVPPAAQRACQVSAGARHARLCVRACPTVHVAQ